MTVMAKGGTATVADAFRASRLEADAGRAFGALPHNVET